MAAKKILLVEDDKASAIMLAYKLKGSGYTVVSAPDGVAAVTLVGTEHPDLVILDLGLPSQDPFSGPNWDGFGVMDWLHRSRPTEPLPGTRRGPKSARWMRAPSLTSRSRCSTMNCSPRLERLWAKPITRLRAKRRMGRPRVGVLVRSKYPREFLCLHPRRGHSFLFCFRPRERRFDKDLFHVG